MSQRGLRLGLLMVLLAGSMAQAQQYVSQQGNPLMRSTGHGSRSSRPYHKYCPPESDFYYPGQELRTPQMAPRGDQQRPDDSQRPDDTQRPDSGQDQTTPDQTQQPQQTPDQTPDFNNQPAPTSSDFSAASSPTTAAPNMIGDSIGGACGTVRYGVAPGGFGGGSIIGSIDHPSFGCARQKIAENNSPMPTDRVYFSYQHFHNATENFILDDDGVTVLEDTELLDVNKFMFGLEKTFFDDQVSVQLQVPFTAQITNCVVQDFRTPPAAPTDMQSDLGNMSLAVKALLYQNCRTGIRFSGGVLLELPTAEDVDVLVYEELDEDSNPATREILNFLVHFHNDQVIVSPFLAALWTPDDLFFFQAFMQVDMPVSHAALDFTGYYNGDLEAQESFLFDGQTMMRLDLGGGIWLYRTPKDRFLSGVALLLEGHYSTTLNDAEVYTIPTPQVTTGVIDFGNVQNRLDLVNLTGGLTFEIAHAGTLTAACVAPVRNQEEKPFDAEFVLQLNLYH